jgi:hypothetical protein
MAREIIGDLTTSEFDQLIENFITREDDRITPSVFLAAMAELERRQATQEVELTGRLVNGDVEFDTPAPLPVDTNTIYVGDTRVKLKLWTESDTARAPAPGEGLGAQEKE